jgi:hypothetical protein
VLARYIRYWLQAPWGWHDSVETCSSVIICEIIVHLLVIVQNNKRCTVQGIKIKLDPLLCRILSLLNDALPTCNLADPYSYLLRAVCICRSYSENAMQIDKSISWIVCMVESKGFSQGTWCGVDVMGWTHNYYCSRSYIKKLNTTKRLCKKWSNDW